MDMIGISIGSFEWALMHLKNGAKIQRKGWNGKGIFVYMVPRGIYDTCTEATSKEFGDKVQYEPYFAIKNVKDTINTWVPSISDLLANDWEVVK